MLCKASFQVCTDCGLFSTCLYAVYSLLFVYSSACCHPICIVCCCNCTVLLLQQNSKSNSKTWNIRVRAQTVTLMPTLNHPDCCLVNTSKWNRDIEVHCVWRQWLASVLFHCPLVNTAFFLNNFFSYIDNGWFSVIIYQFLIRILSDSNLRLQQTYLQYLSARDSGLHQGSSLKSTYGNNHTLKRRPWQISVMMFVSMVLHLWPWK